MEHPETQTVQVSAKTRDDVIGDNVMNVRLKRKGRDMWLVVKEGAPQVPHPFIHKNCPARPSFDSSIPVADDVERIVFGRKKALLWQRSSAFPKSEATK